MKKLVTLFALTTAVVVVLFVSHSLAAPIGKPKGSVYFSTTVGDKSVFERKSKDAGGEQIEEITEIVSAVEVKDGGFVVSVKRDGEGGALCDSTIKVTEKGIFARKGMDGAFDLCRLKLPAKKGDTWEAEEIVVGKSSTKTVYVLAGEDEVEVPAKKFKVVRVDSTTELPNYTLKTSTWYAPNVGVVKMRYNSGGGEVTYSLKSFTPGKK